MRNTPTNSDDVIDSRNVIAWIEKLEGEREGLTDTHAETLEALRDNEDIGEHIALELAEGDALEALQEWEDENDAELAVLQFLAGQAECYADDRRHGATLIRDSYFKEYAQQLADDIGAIDRDARWPQSCINWDQAAEELQADYTSVDFGGVTYWVRR